MGLSSSSVAFELETWKYFFFAFRCMGVVYSQRSPNERRHSYQTTREMQWNVPMRNSSFLNQNPTTWNLLSSEIVEADTVNVFKTRIDRQIESDSPIPVRGFQPVNTQPSRVVTTAVWLFIVEDRKSLLHCAQLNFFYEVRCSMQTLF